MAAAHKAAAPGGGSRAPRFCSLCLSLPHPHCAPAPLRFSSRLLAFALPLRGVFIPPLCGTPPRGEGRNCVLAWVRGWPAACSQASLGTPRWPVLVCCSCRLQSVRLRCSGVLVRLLHQCSWFLLLRAPLVTSALQFLLCSHFFVSIWAAFALALCRGVSFSEWFYEFEGCFFLCCSWRCQLELSFPWVFS